MKKNDPLIRISAQAFAAMRAAYKRDRDHLVALDADYFVGTFRETFRWRGRTLPILPYRCDRFEIRPDRTLWLFKDGDRDPICDGATYAPDKLAGVDLAAGYLPHDFLYDELDRMAEAPEWAAAGWTFDSLRALFDVVLRTQIRMRETVSRSLPWRSRLYYWAVRTFGGAYHRLAVLVVALGTLLALGGCAGCTAPDGVFDSSGELPLYHVVPRG